jgi:N-methylhydantoinase A/oxoprolinase/acetone carboxylase beta subunit
VTVTDANLFLGRLDPERFLGGEMKLFPERSCRVLERLASRLKLDAGTLAEGIIRVADATMERAVRVISVERGFDTRDFALLSFGGAGGMHACSLARRLRIPTVIVPKNAGVLSALGMLLSDTVKDYSLSILKSGDQTSASDLARLFQPLLREARGDLKKEGIPGSRMRLFRHLDVRYIGQSYELTVPFSPGFEREFHRLHLRRYGYADEARPVEVVNLRVKAVGLTHKPRLSEVELKGKDPKEARIGRRSMRFDGRRYAADVYARDKLGGGNLIQGPALVLDYESTAVVPPRFSGLIDRFGNLILRQGR